MLPTIPTAPRAAVRAEVEGKGNQAQLWFRVDRAAQEGRPTAGAFDNMFDRPIKTAAWEYYEIVGDVAADAETLLVGLLLTGQGKVWIDDASLEEVGKDVEVTAKSPGDRISVTGPGLFEVVGSARLTPNETLLQARRSSYREGDRWKETSMTVLLPMPLAYQDQVPMSYELSIQPPHAGDSIDIYNDHLDNHVVRLKLADLLNRKRIDIKFRSTVLVGPSSFTSVPKTAEIPEGWPEEVQPWLKATWCVDSEHERIQEIAKDIRAKTTDVIEIIALVEQRAKAIFDAAEGNANNLTAIEALDNRGSCTSCGNLFAALLRATGIPARVLAGYPSWSGPLQTHYIVEAYVPEYGWYPIESTQCRSPWPNYLQVYVAVIPIEHESEVRARMRRFAAGGVPYLSLTEMPDNHGIVGMRGTVDEDRNCDHVCNLLRKFDAPPVDWEQSIQVSTRRWENWLSAGHKVSSEGKLLFGNYDGLLQAKSLADLESVFQR